MPITTGEPSDGYCILTDRWCQDRLLQRELAIRQIVRDQRDLSLRCGFKFTFPKTSIFRLSRYKGGISTGLQIQHSISRYPEFLLFWTFNFENLKRELEALGYNVRENYVS